jgi:hypothetical protein
MTDTEREAEYIRATDLTKLRIARHILMDVVMADTLSERNQMTRLMADWIKQLEAAAP